MGGALAHPRTRVIDGLLQFDRQRDWFYNRTGIASNDDVPFGSKRPLSRFLLWHPVRDALAKVAIKLIARDRSIAVQIGLASFQPLHQRIGEDRA